VRNFVNSIQQNINSRNHQQPRRQENRENNNGNTCPICLANVYFEVETNCGHKFCGKKILFFLYFKTHWV
jgi:hypothetical protein